MPLNFLDELFDLFSKVFDKLNKEDSDGEKLYEKFLALKISYLESAKVYRDQALADKNAPDEKNPVITEEQAKKLADTFAGVSKSFEELKKTASSIDSSKIDESILDKIVKNPIEIDNICLVMDYYANELKSYSSAADKNEKKPVSLSEIFKQTGWTNKLLHEDKSKSFLDWQKDLMDISTPEKMLSNYYDIKNELAKRYSKHMKQVTNCEKVGECLAVKKKMVESALGKEAAVKHPVFTAYDQFKTSDLIHAMETNDFSNVEEKGFDLGITPAFYEEMKNVTFLAKFADIVSEAAPSMIAPQDDILMARYARERKLDLPGNLEPIRLAKATFSEKLTKLKKDVNDLLEEKGFVFEADNNRETINTVHYVLLMQEMFKILEISELMNNRGRRNEALYNLAKPFKQLGDIFPEVQRNFERGKKPFAKKIQAKLDEMYSNYVPQDYSQIGNHLDRDLKNQRVQNAHNLLDQVDELLSEPFENDEEYNRFYFMCLLKNPAFREEQKAAISEALTEYNRNDQKTIDSDGLAGLYYGFSENEWNKLIKRDDKDATRLILQRMTRTLMYMEYLEGESVKAWAAKRDHEPKNTYAEQLRLSRNMAFDAIGMNGIIENAEDALKIDESRTALNHNKYSARLMNGKNEEMVEYLTEHLNGREINNQFNEYIYGGQGDFFQKYSDQIKGLTQTSGNLYSSNSAEYKHIGEALVGLRQAEYRGADPEAADYEKLYESLVTYLKVHKNHPGSKNGRLRVDSALRLLPEVALKLVGLDPSMADRVTHDLQLQMARREDFKIFYSRFVKNSIDAHNKLKREINGENYKGLSKSEKAIADVTYSTLRFAEAVHAEIDGKCDTPEREDAILQGYREQIKDIEKSMQIFKDKDSKHKISIGTGTCMPNISGLQQASWNARTEILNYYNNNANMLTDKAAFKNGTNFLCEKLAIVFANQKLINQFGKAKKMPEDYDELRELDNPMNLETDMVELSTSPVMKDFVTKMGTEGLAGFAVDNSSYVAVALTRLYGMMASAAENNNENDKQNAEDYLNSWNSKEMDMGGWNGLLQNRMAQKLGEAKEAVLAKNDHQVVDCVAQAVYSYYLKDKYNGGSFSLNVIKKDFGSNYSKTVEELKPCVAMILNGMSDVKYKAFVNDKEMVEKVWKEIGDRYAEPADRYASQAEYEKNLAANNGVFVRTAKVPMFGM